MNWVGMVVETMSKADLMFNAARLGISISWLVLQGKVTCAD